MVFMPKIPPERRSLSVQFVGRLPLEAQSSVYTQPKQQDLPVESLKSTQQYVDKDKVDDIAEYEHIEEPIKAIRSENSDDEYYIYDGHHRVHAARQAGLTHVPAYVYNHWFDLPAK